MAKQRIDQNGRRDFFKKAGITTAGLMLVKPESILGAPANSKITLGIIGSGGRGFFVGKKFIDNVGNDIQIVAAHDYFADRLERVQNNFNIEKSRTHTGLYGYREILHSNVDAVIITTPPYFHPEQAAEAVNAGKHVWLAKPVAVDVPGCLSIKETGKKAAGKTAFLVDFQSRNSPFFVEAAKRVHEGVIGEIITAESYNLFPRYGKIDTSGLPENWVRLRNYPTDPVLSGDFVVDQAVHAMDIVNWFMGANPVRAFGSGGLKARLNLGKNWDHFIILFWYPNGAKVELNASQFMKGYEKLGAAFFGNNGVCNAHYRGKEWGQGSVSITGDHAWEGTPFDNTWDIGVDNNCKDFVAALRSGKYMNCADYAADSAMTCVLGRQAGYEERVVTWDEILKKNEKLELNIKL